MATDGAVLQIIDAAYRVDCADDTWLADLAAAARPFLDQGFGLSAFEFRRAGDGPPQILQSHRLGIPEALAENYRLIFETMDPEIRRRPFQLGPCVTGSQLMGMHGEFAREPHMQKHAQRFGMYDSLWITAAEPEGFGVGFHAGRAKIGWTTRREQRRWGMLAGHLANAARLRRCIHTRCANHDAVLDHKGRVVHADGDASGARARAALERAALLYDNLHARAAPERQDEALASFRGLVAGRWSLVAQIEVGGRRYLMARENEPRASGADLLTPREKQVVSYAKLGHHNKLIAYELGIADSTVRVLLARAAAKLGVRTRAELQGLT